MSKRTELRSLLETVGVVIGSIVGAIVLIVFATTKYEPSEPANSTVVEAKPSSENVMPVADVKVAKDSTSDTKASISGEKIATANCAMCHASGLMNAPKIGDAGQWGPRIAQGKDMLISNAINGIRTMPAKGGNASLTDEEVAAAVIFMANASGGSL
ncbi:MAG: c-type cytochrome [Methylophilaceae bacterium]|jgi:cytochrome c5|nr:c-type cytochrome [Methylophilaceae bacterium]